MKPKRKTLGQIAYDASGYIIPYRDLDPATHAYWEKHAAAVAKEVLHRARKTDQMKPKRKTLGQIAYDASGNEPGIWDKVGEYSKQEFEAMALAVAKEVLRRSREHDIWAIQLRLSHVE